MPSSTLSSSTSDVGQSTSPSVNALISGIKWGGVTGTEVTLTYSFPWTTSVNATFSGYNGIGDYSILNEQNATYHQGLSTTEQAAARSALQSWANVANITFSGIAESSSNVGDIRFAWTSATDLVSSGEQAWGWGYYPDSYWPSGGDIWISTLSPGATDTDWSVGSYNFQALIHELGHALGLKHSFEGGSILPSGEESEKYTIMSYTDHPNNLFRDVIPNANGTFSFNYFYVVADTPMLYDVAAIQYLYGANLSYKTENDTYTFDPASPFYRTIWDAGGTDTISVSNFSKACIIDLQQGHFSKITIESDPIPSGYSGGTTPTYDGTDNLAIAFGCVIENAIGGWDNDTLLGNDANNSLNGGGGNDILNGGAGIDTALYSGIHSLYNIKASSNGAYTVASTAEGTDTFSTIEKIKFADITVDLTGQVQTPVANVIMPPAKADVPLQVQEGQGAWFQVQLPGQATQIATVDFTTRDGSAIAGQDYISTHGTLTLAVGQWWAKVWIQTLADSIIEGNETFSLVLTNPHGATFPANQTELTAQRTILDDVTLVGSTQLADILFV